MMIMMMMMMKWSCGMNKEDLRIDYMFIRYIEREKGTSNLPSLVNIKRDLRRKSRLSSTPEDIKIFQRENEWDAYYEYFGFPEEVKTIEDARQFFNEYIRIELPYSSYDCTGRPFTAYAKFYDFGAEGIACLHRIDLDV